MNEINHKRLVNALEELKQLEEELVPCCAEEDHALFLLREGEIYTQEMTDKYLNLLSLEMALSDIRRAALHLRQVIKNNN